MQDGMLAYYLSQARMADANVEATIEREPFDFRDLMRHERPLAGKSAKGLKSIRRRMGSSPDF